MQCGSSNHLITTCPGGLKVVEKGVERLLAPPHQVVVPPKSTMVRRACVMSKKEASMSSTIVIGTLFLNSKAFSLFM